MPQSIRYQISAAFVEALKTTFEPGTKVKRNPREPSPARDGPRVVFFADTSDAFIEQPGQLAKRVFVFEVGAINRTDDAEAGADADYVAAEATLRSAFATVAQVLKDAGAQLGPLRERGVAFKVEDIDVDGALVLGEFEIEYRRSAPPR